MAVLVWAPESAISHMAAGALWSLEGCAQGSVDLLTHRGRRPTAEWITLHRTSRLEPFDITMIGPIRVTTTTRTLVDLCGILDRDGVEPAMHDALRRGLTSLPRLRWAASRLGGRGRPGA